VGYLANDGYYFGMSRYELAFMVAYTREVFRVFRGREIRKEIEKRQIREEKAFPQGWSRNLQLHDSSS